MSIPSWAGERAEGRKGKRVGSTLRQVVGKRKYSTTTMSNILLTDLSAKRRVLRQVYRRLDKEVVTAILLYNLRFYHESIFETVHAYLFTNTKHACTGVVVV